MCLLLTCCLCVCAVCPVWLMSLCVFALFVVVDVVSSLWVVGFSYGGVCSLVDVFVVCVFVVVWPMFLLCVCVLSLCVCVAAVVVVCRLLF